METVIWESTGKAHNGAPFLSIKENNGYYYAERAGIDSVAFVLYDRALGEVACVSERKPPLDARVGEPVFVTTAFGGSIDKEHTNVQIVIEEVKEEAGFIATADDIAHVGSVLVSTQMNQYCHLYVVFVNKYDEGEKDPQTEMEAEAEVVWMDFHDVFDIEDWKAPTIMVKASRLGLL
jgi:8-oxo-dGTP pyrophosphatase MutT (NUDIX family)